VCREGIKEIIEEIGLKRVSEREIGRKRIIVSEGMD
jgi:hypothetical protein